MHFLGEIGFLDTSFITWGPEWLLGWSSGGIRGIPLYGVGPGNFRGGGGGLDAYSLGEQKCRYYSHNFLPRRRSLHRYCRDKIYPIVCVAWCHPIRKSHRLGLFPKITNNTKLCNHGWSGNPVLGFIVLNRLRLLLWIILQAPNQN